MKINKILSLLLILTLISCKGEPLEKKAKIDAAIVRNEFKKEENKDYTTDKNIYFDDCYDYLTELVRSSNFPFSEWKINKSKVNLIIDEDGEKVITAKLFYDTDGTGTLGWIEYYKENGKLFNTSANLDKPIELQYDMKWRGLYESCSQTKEKSSIKTDTLNDKSLEGIYNNCKELPLPNKYDFNNINEEKGFIDVEKKYYKMFPVEHKSNYKIAKLPIIHKSIRPYPFGEPRHC